MYFNTTAPGLRRTLPITIITGMKIAIIVLNYNNHRDTAECLRSLAGLDYPDYSVTVVDNCSSDGSAERLSGEFPHVFFLCNHTNLGFADGNNQGIRHALEEGADLVWLLNNDTVVEPGALRGLVEAAEAEPRAGILGSVVYYYDQPERVNFAGGRVVRYLGKGIHLTTLTEGAAPFETDFVTGASLMVRADAAGEAGVLDGRFFLYMEDLDWCQRMKKAGWKVIMVPSSRVRHKINETTGRDRPRIIYYVCRNSLLCCRKNFPVWLPVVMAAALRRYVVNYLGRYALSRFDRRELEHARMGLKGITDFLRGRGGAYCN